MTRVTANTEEDVSSNIALKYVSLAKLAQLKVVRSAILYHVNLIQIADLDQYAHSTTMLNILKTPKKTLKKRKLKIMRKESILWKILLM